MEKILQSPVGAFTGNKRTLLGFCEFKILIANYVYVRLLIQAASASTKPLSDDFKAFFNTVCTTFFLLDVIIWMVDAC